MSIQNRQFVQRIQGLQEETTQRPTGNKLIEALLNLAEAGSLPHNPDFVPIPDGGWPIGGPTGKPASQPGGFENEQEKKFREQMEKIMMYLNYWNSINY